MAKSRAEYFRERRKKKKQISFILEREKIEKLDKKLEEKNQTRTEWLREKIDEEIK